MYKAEAYISVSLLLPPFSYQSVAQWTLLLIKHYLKYILIYKFDISASSVLDNTLFILFLVINLIY